MKISNQESLKKLFFSCSYRCIYILNRFYILGPLTWSEYYPAASGDKQSPIDINPIHQKNLHPIKRLTWKYNSENSETVTNTGCGWRVDVNGKGSGNRNLIHYLSNFSSRRTK